MEEVEKYLPLLEKLIEQGREIEIITLLTKIHPADIAKLIDSLEEEEKKKLFGLLEIKTASEVIAEIDEISRELILEDLPPDKLTQIVDRMETDDATDLIADLPEEQAKSILSQIKKEDSEEVQKLLKYGEDTAGGIMRTELVSLPQDFTVEKAIEKIRSVAHEIEDIHNAFVVDNRNQLVGVLPLRKLILAQPDTVVSYLMNPDPIKVNTNLDQEEVANIFKKYDIISLPVVDEEGKLVGKITIDDIVDVIEEEASEDFYRLAGLDKDEHVFTPPSRSIQMRLPWLFINLFTATLAASVVSLFEDTIKTLVVLAIFMPMVAGIAGNAGTQTLTVIVRSLALGELTLKNAKKALFKQIIVGITNGVIIGLIMATIAYFWKGIPMLGVIIGAAMIMNLGIASLGGTLIPLILKWFKVDPAIASSIFITALTDSFGFLSFLGLATIFLKYLL